VFILKNWEKLSDFKFKEYFIEFFRIRYGILPAA